MKEWKDKVMQEMTRELHSIRQIHEEEMDAQRQGFQIELERVGGKLEQLELRSIALENEVKALRLPGQLATRKSPPAKAVALSSSGNEDTRDEGQTEDPRYKERTSKHQQVRTQMTQASTPNQPMQTQSSTTPPRKSYAQMAASGSPKVTTENVWTEVTGSSRRRKATTPTKVEPEKRRVIFRREASSPQKSEADLMLALNEALQKAGISTYTRFSRVGYSQSGAISALLTEKSSAEQLVGNHSNILIRAAKAVDAGVIGVEALERWQRLKVHGMSLARYLGEGKMELLCREIESSTGIQLKTVPRWLISESRLEERLESGTGRGSAIVITVGTSEEAVKLCSKGLRFGGALKVVEKYWEAGPSSVCLSCAGVGHDRLGECGARAVQCVICAGAHKAEDHRCGVMGCTVKMGKICTHVTPKCANCGAKHQATAFKCPARLKAQAEAWREKSKKFQAKGKQPATPTAPEEEPEATSNEMEVDTSSALWTKNLEQLSSDLSSLEDDRFESPGSETSEMYIDESLDHTKKF